MFWLPLQAGAAWLLPSCAAAPIDGSAHVQWLVDPDAAQHAHGDAMAAEFGADIDAATTALDGCGQCSLQCAPFIAGPAATPAHASALDAPLHHRSHDFMSLAPRQAHKPPIAAA